MSKRIRSQRGATLTGYSLTFAAFAVAALGSVSALESSSTDYLSDTGTAIGTPRPPVAALIDDELDGVAATFPTSSTTPSSTAAPTTPSTAAPTSASTASTAPPTTPSTAPPAPSPGGSAYSTYTFTQSAEGTAVSSESGRENDCIVSGDPVSWGTCDGGSDQQLVRYTIQGTSPARSVLELDGECLTWKGGTGSGSLKTQSCSEGNNNQEFVFNDPDGDGVGEWRMGSDNNKCLDGYNGWSQPAVWNCDGSNEQQWTLP